MGRTPGSARVPLDPPFTDEIDTYAIDRPTGASAADLGVRPTMNADDAKSARGALKLAPMAFCVHIPVMAALVAGRHPFPTGVWRLFPPAGLPTVGIAIPVLVSLDPDVLPARSNGTLFVDANRGTKLNYDLRMSSGRERKSKTK